MFRGLLMMMVTAAVLCAPNARAARSDPVASNPSSSNASSSNASSSNASSSNASSSNASAFDATAFDETCADAVDTEGLAHFDAELRNALATVNSAQLALLVSYPLRVNVPDGGTRSIADPQALQTDISATFPNELIAAVLNSSRRDVACLPKGIMYAGGALWVYPVPFDGLVSLRINAINLPRGTTRVREGESLLEFVCATQKHRVVVDSADDAYRYRAWNRPRAVSETPDVEVRSGADALQFEGTGPCAAKRWSFPRGNVKYIVGELGCTDGSEPDDARGRLDVEIGGEIKQTAWCR